MAHFASKGLFRRVLTSSGKLGTPMNAVAVLAHTPRMMLSVFVWAMSNELLLPALIGRFSDSRHYFILLCFLASKIAVDSNLVTLKIERRLEVIHRVVI